MKVLLLDNYDSFTFNLHHYLVQFDLDVAVFRNDAIQLEAMDEYDAIVLSPGPGLPQEAGILMDVIARYHDKKPLLGVCLGHQAICEFFGGELINLATVWHGRESEITTVSPSNLFDNIAMPMTVGHYHSWSVDPMNVGRNMVITAVNDKGWVMAVEHEKHAIVGLQFHPESVMTPDGLQLIQNWVKSIRKP